MHPDGEGYILRFVDQEHGVKIEAPRAMIPRRAACKVTQVGSLTDSRRISNWNNETSAKNESDEICANNGNSENSALLS